MSTIYRVGQCFGAQYVIGVLRGMQNQKILERQHDKLSVYGIGKDKSKEHWQSVIRQLIHLGFIQQVIGEFNTTLQLTENAKPVLKGEIPLELAMPRISAISKIAHSPQRSTMVNYDKDLLPACAFYANKSPTRKISLLILCSMMQHYKRWHNICRPLILKCCKLTAWEQ
ncbi:ATP-dependent DNA helicase RecQ [Rodentibacter pneumotropicus]|uniref:ATP-dependent DNA helicase RecQ n=1 Tax=Rodentibacter pneumotropicus TaxID=758 RepID=A0A448MIJ5_9PAST|nr:ATP-dependent DNA helicase RecQ [Rodentibacter pneumotropicus]